MNEIVSLKKNQTVLELPESAMPFYIAAKEGLFLHRKIVLGTAVVRTKTMPANLGELGNNEGMFWWSNEMPIIPAEICAQAVSFFRRIYEKYKTEAEVILTFNVAEKSWRIFVPTQKVSGSAVDSVYEPSHISPGYLIVGTIHSHCNFSAFHSGTDSADADDMDGIHITVGMLQKDIPEVVSMVSVNKVQFTFSPEEVADFSNLEAAVAPEWWDRYVTPNASIVSGHKPVGYKNFLKYQPNVSKTALVPVSSPKYMPSGNAGYSQYGWSDWDGDENYLDTLLKNQYRPERILTSIKKDEKYFEESLPRDMVDAIFDSTVITDEDLDDAIRAGSLAGTPDYWQILFVEKLVGTINVLHKLGMDVTYNIPMKEIKNGSHSSVVNS